MQTIFHCCQSAARVLRMQAQTITMYIVHSRQVLVVCCARTDTHTHTYIKFEWKLQSIRPYTNLDPPQYVLCVCAAAAAGGWAVATEPILAYTHINCSITKCLLIIWYKLYLYKLDDAAMVGGGAAYRKIARESYCIVLICVAMREFIYMYIT